MMMSLLAIDWGSVGVKAGQFVLSFSILVILHEMGHYLPAKWFKCRVEKFYLFFDAWFSLFKKKIGETEWGIGWIPFGGYVKIAGMIDESMDKEQLKQPAQPWEFRSKPAWQRLIIMVGGVIVNVILAIVIFIGIMWVWGEEYLPGKNAKYGIEAQAMGKQIGLQDGDVVIKAGDKELRNALNTGIEIIVNDAKYITVLRNGAEVVLPIPDGFIKELSRTKGRQFAEVRFPSIISEVAKKSNAEKAGLLAGDQILSIDSATTPYWYMVSNHIKSHVNKNIQLTVLRKTDTVKLMAKVSEEGKIGIGPEGNLSKLGFKIETKEYSFVEAIPAGINNCFQTLDMYITGLKQLFSGKVSAKDSLGSVISIGNTFPGEWIWREFWRLTAIFSIILAFMNILPIPALDGGHALFCIIEMVTGRKPGDKFMEYAQMAGMILMLGLMAYALGLDFWRIFK